MFTVADCEDLRRRIKTIAEDCNQMRLLAGQQRFEPLAEAMANMTLAYRHLEDASMRLGKAIQALDGGVSVYDKTQVPA